MRILVANHSLSSVYGSETYVRTLVTTLLALGHEVSCFSDRLGTAASELRSMGVETVPDAREATPPDVIHASHLDSGQLAMSAWPLTPVVFVVHGRGMLQPVERPPLARQSIERWVAISEIVGDFMSWRDGIDSEEIEVIPNLIDLERFRPLAPLRSPARRVLFLGSLSDVSCYPLVEQACRRAGMTARLAGGRSRSSDVRSELQYADIVISIGRGAVEGAACGRPVIVMSDLGGDGLLTPETAERELAHNYSGLALRVMPSVEELADQLSRATAELGEWSRGWVEQHHDAKRLVPRLVTLYESAIASARERLERVGAAAVLQERYHELYPALRWWTRLPHAADWALAERAPLSMPHVDEELESAAAPFRDAYECALNTAKRNGERWQDQYERLAGAAPIAAALWVRRRLSGRRNGN